MGRPKLPPNPIRSYGSFSAVGLYGQNGEGRVALLDTGDVERIRGRRWYGWKFPRSKTIYALAWETTGDREAVYMHRLILDAGDADEVDHFDNDGLNNRRYNLRCTDHSNNVQNQQGPRIDNQSGFKGVYARGDKFRAQIRKNGKLHNLGSYATAEEAALAYDDAAQRLFGERFASSFPSRQLERRNYEDSSAR